MSVKIAGPIIEESPIPKHLRAFHKAPDRETNIMAYEKGIAVGILTYRQLSPTLAYVFAIIVHPDYQGRGIANAMTDYLHDTIRLMPEFDRCDPENSPAGNAFIDAYCKRREGKCALRDHDASEHTALTDLPPETQEANALLLKFTAERKGTSA